MKNRNGGFNKTPYVLLVAIAFVIWAAIFIWRTSFIGIDGVRHFCLFDDAMISMRYAWNLSHGLGLVWNQGELVEGFTNPLMTLYMSLATLVFSKGQAVLFIQVSGIAFMLGIAYVTMRIAGEVFRDYSPRTRDSLMVLSFAAPLCYYPLAYWTLMGMETGLLTLLLLLGTWVAIRSDGKSKIVWILPILLGLAFLTRPDALVPIALIALYRLWQVFRQGRWLRTFFVEMAILAIFVISWSIFRWEYYGELLPNTYTLKMTGMPLAPRIRDGLAFVLAFFVGGMLAPTSLAVLNVTLRLSKIRLLLISLFLSSIVYQIYVGGDAWPYWRMMSWSVPMLFVLCIDEIWRIVRVVFRTEAMRDYISQGPHSSQNPIIPRVYLEKAAVLGILFLLLVAANFGFKWEIVGIADPYTTVWGNRINVNTAIALNEIAAPSASVGVFWAGTIPYYTSLKAVDMLGKCDKYIASLPPRLSDPAGGICPGMKSWPGHNKYDLIYSIEGLRPTYVQGFQWVHDDLSAFRDENYVEVEYKGVKLWLLKDSGDILWEKVRVNP